MPDNPNVGAALVGAIALIFGGIITGIYNLVSKRNEYRNDYYKYIVGRRVDAYSGIEVFLTSFRAVHVLDSGERVHTIFFSEGAKETIYNHIIATLGNSLWLSSDVNDEFQNFTAILNGFPDDRDALVTYAKDISDEISEFRHNLEALMARDMMSLYDVRGFLSSKRKEKSEYKKINVKMKR